MKKINYTQCDRETRDQTSIKTCIDKLEKSLHELSLVDCYETNTEDIRFYDPNMSIKKGYERAKKVIQKRITFFRNKLI